MSAGFTARYTMPSLQNDLSQNCCMAYVRKIITGCLGSYCKHLSSDVKCLVECAVHAKSSALSSWITVEVTILPFRRVMLRDKGQERCRDICSTMSVGSFQLHPHPLGSQLRLHRWKVAVSWYTTPRGFHVDSLKCGQSESRRAESAWYRDVHTQNISWLLGK